MERNSGRVMTTNHGLTLKIFLVDGVSSGLMTAEIMNWTGHFITGPRSGLADLVMRPESRRTGVYFLIGPDAAGVGTAVYIGETDDITQRLTAHNRPEEKGGKDFWEKFCIVTSKDANLTKSHVKYLESRLIKIALAAKRSRLLNGTGPDYSSLPEADLSDMEFFLAQIQTLLPVLGFDFLRETAIVPILREGLLPNATNNADATVATESPTFVGDVKKHDVTARGKEIDGEFVVLAGSKTRKAWEGVQSGYKSLFTELVANQILVLSPDGRHRIFSRDYAFSSPSAAAAIVTGRNANGRIHWVDPLTGLTYGSWQEAKLNRVLPTASSNAS